METDAVETISDARSGIFIDLTIVTLVVQQIVLAEIERLRVFNALSFECSQNKACDLSFFV